MIKGVSSYTGCKRGYQPFFKGQRESGFSVSLNGSVNEVASSFFLNNSSVKKNASLVQSREADRERDLERLRDLDLDPDRDLLAGE